MQSANNRWFPRHKLCGPPPFFNGRALATPVSHFVTDGSETVGTGRDGSGSGAAEKRYEVTLFGNGRDRLEPPSLGSTPGHPRI